VVPQNSSITSAEFLIYCASSGNLKNWDEKCYLFPIEKEWLPGDATWMNRKAGIAWDTFGGDFSVNNSCVIKAAKAGAWETYSVTGLIKYFVGNPQKNFGLFLYPSEKTITDQQIGGMCVSQRYYVSSDNETDSLKPKLVINCDVTGNETKGYDKTAVLKGIRLDNNTFPLRLYVPLSGDHNVVVKDVRGRILEFFTGRGKGWYTFSSNYFSDGLYFVVIHSNQEVFVKKFSIIR